MTRSGVIAKAAVVPPAYAPMRYVNKTSTMLASKEFTGDFQIDIDPPMSTDGSGFAVISISGGAWKIAFDVSRVADV